MVAGLALTTIPAVAQPIGEHRVVLRDTIRSFRERAYQGRNNGPEQTERFTRKVKVGRDGRVSLANIAGDITVTAGSGDEVSIDAVKRTRGDRSELAAVQIVIDERPGRLEVRTEGERNRSDRNRRGNQVSVDYTVTLPAAAAIDVHSVSGTLTITGIHGAVRAETVSGDVVATDTPKLEVARSVSGNVLLTGSGAEGDLSAGSVSGNITVKGLKARGLDIGSVSGDLLLSDVTCDRMGVKSVSGNVEYSGALVKSGRYDINSHSGTIRLMLAGTTGFELNANSFSGSIRSDLPLTIGGDTARQNRGTSGRRGPFNSHTMRATFGDGSATLTLRTFSGAIVIAKR
jgi:DUF4097 and DUF4098 domain-containing protein YvlB